ncbi:hypothetical protein G6F57_015614 [Rhizopus arrhizus]|nr:hypothetical protein G6F28_013770 [Rhizopus arrhizus]KAG1015645.1 hypothetical protein G6F26_013129 [Rhizopus arrhizus]KAG1081616.1 hypothetical protein G6F39_013857 [Rhizopus arrhizus]KAG1255971.1 hypothetical protein G6F65_016518 [Rhizopus arrhizus]KAG1323707.1 hypothetical protein G6F63_012881 [Rhizopus arrhizus]
MYGYEPKTPFDIDNRVFQKSSHKFESVLWHRTTHQLHNLNWIREQSVQAIKQTQATQKKAIENKILDERRELKPPFRLGDLVLLYKDYTVAVKTGRMFSCFAYTRCGLLHFLVYSNVVYTIRKNKLWVTLW